MKQHHIFTGITFFILSLLWSQDTIPESIGKYQPDLIKSEMHRAGRWMQSAQPLTPSMHRYDVLHYQLFLDVQPDIEEIAGQVIMTAAVTDTGLTDLDLNLSDNMVVSTVSVDGNSTSFTHESNILSISITETPAVGDTIAVDVSYSGSPVGTNFGSFAFSSRNGNHHIWTLSEPYGARDWWPCKDMPTDKPESVEIIVRVPDPLVVASNGLLTEIRPNGDETTTYTWNESYPIATYLVSLAIYPYDVWEDEYISANQDTMPLIYFVYPDHYTMVQANYLKTKDMIAAFADRFGEYPFLTEKYGHAEFGWGGGMEHQTMTSLGGYSEGLIAHELAHMWWGDMITCANFHHIWLNEGFATYSEAMWWEDQYGEETFQSVMNNRKFYGGGTIYVDDTTNVGTIFDGNLSYYKASWVLHMLRHVVGDPTFFDILRAYADDPNHRYGHATTEEFRAICEAESGMDLTAFFQQWIYGEYYPRYTIGYLQDGTNLRVVIEQDTYNSFLFEMPLDLTIEGELAPPQREVVFQNSASNEYNFTLPEGMTVADVVVDPDDWVLCTVEYQELTTDGDLVPWSLSLAPVYPNPFNASTTIQYSLDRVQPVYFTITDLTGRVVWSLKREHVSAGRQQLVWNGKHNNGSSVASGVYFLQMRTANNRNVFREKMVLLK